MLIGVSPLISPELLALLARMGHGDELVLADAHFPGETFNPRVLRADGLRIPDLLDGILRLINLDACAETRGDDGAGPGRLPGSIRGSRLPRGHR